MRILDYDPLSGETTSFQYDEMKDDVIIGYHQDISNVLDYNKSLANDADYTKRGMKESWWHYAKVPNIVQMKMKMEKGIDFHEPAHADAVFRYLNDPENKYLRTTSKVHWPKKT